MAGGYLVGHVLVVAAKLYFQASGERADVHAAVQPSCLAKRISGTKMKLGSECLRNVRKDVRHFNFGFYVQLFLDCN